MYKDMSVGHVNTARQGVSELASQQRVGSHLLPFDNRNLIGVSNALPASWVGIYVTERGSMEVEKDDAGVGPLLRGHQRDFNKAPDIDVITSELLKIGGSVLEEKFYLHIKKIWIVEETKKERFIRHENNVDIIKKQLYGELSQCRIDSSSVQYQCRG
ncbi:hypothetical protein EVAR_21031_1 [Eumeta japonica]|uniref:Uncharacterized protein n=1 Tax=Eumeta variegata TaxID=151549 RepID=A0A4C1UZT6_EUMVA|nr:hypothetical protein EVAR_21031_1 [Eumeta japonica]